MITSMITGSAYAMNSLQQNMQYKADAVGYMSELRDVQVSQKFGEALVERTEEVRVQGNEFVADVVDATVSYEPPKGHIVNAWA